MKAFLKILFFSTLCVGAFASNIYDYKLDLPRGKTLDFSEYKDRPILIVNIATKCGYTPQLDDLESLHQKYKDKGLLVVGVPSNEFGGQSPESDEKVEEFCRVNYGAKFPISKKTLVKGKNKSPLFSFIIGKSPDISWNFEKFLVSKSGELVKRYASKDSVNDPSFISDIEKNL